MNLKKEQKQRRKDNKLKESQKEHIGHGDRNGYKNDKDEGEK